mgnify:CR=1 FL=1
MEHSKLRYVPKPSHHFVSCKKCRLIWTQRLVGRILPLRKVVDEAMQFVIQMHISYHVCQITVIIDWLTPELAHEKVSTPILLPVERLRIGAEQIWELFAHKLWYGTSFLLRQNNIASDFDHKMKMIWHQAIGNNTDSFRLTVFFDFRDCKQIMALPFLTGKSKNSPRINLDEKDFFRIVYQKISVYPHSSVVKSRRKRESQFK